MMHLFARVLKPHSQKQCIKLGMHYLDHPMLILDLEILLGHQKRKQRISLKVVHLRIQTPFDDVNIALNTQSLEIANDESDNEDEDLFSEVENTPITIDQMKLILNHKKKSHYNVDSKKKEK